MGQKAAATRLHQIERILFLQLPVDGHPVGDELVAEELVRREDGEDGDAQVHELAAEEAERVHVELVVDVLLELAQHPAHLLLRVVHHAARGAWNIVIVDYGSKPALAR